MRFKIDENLHDDVADLISARGYDAHAVHSEQLRGADDRILRNHCLTEERVLVTFDMDFADIRTYPPEATSGIIVLRLSTQSRSHVLAIMASVIDHLKQHAVAQRLWIVSDSDIRIREDKTNPA